jgi:hypothetical protein
VVSYSGRQGPAGRATEEEEEEAEKNRRRTSAQSAAWEGIRKKNIVAQFF